MADVRLSPQTLSPGGIAPSYTGSLSVANTYMVRNDGHVFLHFKKSGAGDCVVTVQTPDTVGGLAIAERTFTVPATVGDIMAGPFPSRPYNDTSHDLRFTLSEITNLSVAVVHL